MVVERNEPAVYVCVCVCVCLCVCAAQSALYLITYYVPSSETYSFAKGEVFSWPVEVMSVSEEVLHAISLL